MFIGFCMVATGFGSSFMTLGGFTLLAIATAVVIVNVVLAPPGYLSSFLEFGPLVWIGRISYGLYLWHYPIFKATNFLKMSWPVQLAVALALTVMVTSLSYYLIERPALSLKRRHKKAQERVITAR
jgi:peptidoglycan/LPS O-acetylase OafA/YrhL